MRLWSSYSGVRKSESQLGSRTKTKNPFSKAEHECVEEVTNSQTVMKTCDFVDIIIGRVLKALKLKQDLFLNVMYQIPVFEVA